MTPRKQNKSTSNDFVDQEKIFIDGNGKFPKQIIITEKEKKQEYKLRKTRKGKYLLNK